VIAAEPSLAIHAHLQFDPNRPKILRERRTHEGS
jgi:hypothetical protein